MHITLRNRQRSIPVDARRLEQFARGVAPDCLRKSALLGAPLQTLAEIEIAIVSDRVIAEVHQRFMGITGPTDVITFDHGEIVISAQMAAANAREYGVPVEREIALCIIHGLLHLNGHDDRTAADAARMHEVQTAILTAASGR